MINVNNKKEISKLSSNSFKASKLRNIFAVIAIILTTVLFTGMFTVVGSLLSSMEESTIRQVGTSAHGAFKYLTQEQYDKLKTHPSIVNVSYSVVLGIAENPELSKRPSEIRYANDELQAKNTFSLPSVGRLPQADNEIATDSIVLGRLGVPAELGQEITLEYSLDGEKYSETFELVGFWEGDKLMSASQVWLNRGYVEKQLENHVYSGKGDMIGTINADVNFSDSFNIEGRLLKVIADSGYNEDEIAIGVNWAYGGNNGSLEAGTVISTVCAVLMIVFCGYLIISNIFYISVAKDIQFYGLLKTIGTTGKQIRYIIRRQAGLLCIIGIPLGLFAGYFVGALLTPLVLSVLNTNVIKVVVNPIAFLISMVFAILTVFISVEKPSKMAARVSPIEALHSTDSEQKSKKTNKKSTGINLWNISVNNVFRNRKKAIRVTVSLSLSLIILNSAYSMANSFDMDKYIGNMIGSDFAIGDISAFNLHIDYVNQDTLNSTFLSELSAKKGIETIDNIYFAEPEVETDPRLADIPSRAEKELSIDDSWLENMRQALQNPKLIQHIYGLDKKTLDKLTVFDGEIDFEKLEGGKYVICAPYDTGAKLRYYNVGDKVTIANVDGVNKEYEVLAIATLPYNISCQHTHPITPEFFMSSSVFLSDIQKKSPMLTTLDVEDSYESEMESFLSDYCQNQDTNMNYSSKATLAAEYENTQSTYKSVGLILSLLVAFIGVMNFVNTVVTSIISRKRELAMLQSIGMTNKQTEIMLIGEGLVYTVLTSVFALTVGSVIGFLAVAGLTGGSIYLTTTFTVLPSIACLPILALIAIIVPYISGKIMSKSSVVERLRAIG